MNGQHRQARGLLDLDVGGTWHLLQHLRYLFGGAVHRIHVVAEHLDRHVATHAGKQFVEPHLDRLGELVIVAGHLGHCLLHGVDQVGLGALRIGPFRLRLQHDKVVRDVGRHRVGGDLGGADFGENPVDFRELLDGLLQSGLHLDRLRQAGAWNAQGVQRDIAFVKTRHELAAHARGQ